MKQAGDYRITLNFLSITECLPDFVVFRKLRKSVQEASPQPDHIRAYTLPRNINEIDHRESYWISGAPVEGFEEFRVQSSFNRKLALWALFEALLYKCSANLSVDNYWVPRGFIREIQFTMHVHPEGEERLVLQPYYLRTADKFGFVADFHFRKAEGIKFSRRVQQLSLSLDKNYRRNLDYYVDRFKKIDAFVEARWEILSQIYLPGASDAVIVNRELQRLPASRLPSRTYIFADGKEGRSQFIGLRDYGPLQPLNSSPVVLFMFREQDRQAARDLAMALRGSRKYERFAFPGFEALFKARFTINSNPVLLTDFSRQSMEQALQRVNNEQGLVVPILVMPDDETAYLNHKAVFANSRIPTQVCTVGVIQDENTLKWSIANIALQIFCKAGGLPWKVKADGESSLIIGISQSHKVRHDSSEPSIERYFAFSILTDSSGLFQKIQVLAEAETETDYLAELKKNLADILKVNVGRFSRVVIHTSFKLKLGEIDAIEAVVKNASSQVSDNETQFAVVKVNHATRFFGGNQGVNSFVPYEGSVLRLGYGEYLIWFEGIFPDRPTVTKAFAGPTHIQFLRFDQEKNVRDETLLQELMNLSGANWRGFNAKTAPVSVFYCHLVADLVHDFQERGLPLPAVDDLRPWFL